MYKEPDSSHVISDIRRTTSGKWRLTLRIPDQLSGHQVDQIVVRSTCPQIFAKRPFVEDDAPVWGLTLEKWRPDISATYEPVNGTPVGTPTAVQAACADLTSTRDPSQQADPGEMPSPTEVNTSSSYGEKFSDSDPEAQEKPHFSNPDAAPIAKESDRDGMGAASLEDRLRTRKRTAEADGCGDVREVKRSRRER